MTGVRDVLADGGPIVWLLGALSLFSLALIAVKVWQLRAALSGQGRRARALDLWLGRDKTGARRALVDGRAPADLLLAQAMTGLDGGAPRKLLEDDLEWRGNAELADLSSGLRMLELIAMVSPLLGLLGTVLGMIEAFRELSLAEGSANAALLAAGIWQALLTTAAGLIVAIPAAVAAGLLGARVDRAGQQAEAAVGRLFAIEDRLER